MINKDEMQYFVGEHCIAIRKDHEIDKAIHGKMEQVFASFKMRFGGYDNNRDMLPGQCPACKKWVGLYADERYYPLEIDCPWCKKSIGFFPKEF